MTASWWGIVSESGGAGSVTNGDSHDHQDGDGAAIDHANLTGVTATQHHSNANDPTSDEKAALAGTSGTSPSSSNKLVDNADPRLDGIPSLAGIVSDSLVFHFLAANAKNGTAPGNNSDPTSTLDDLTGARDLTTHNYGWTTSSGWAGAGSEADPYRLVCDGDGDYSSGSALAIPGNFTIEAWLNAVGSANYQGVLSCYNGGGPSGSDPGWALYLSVGKPRVEMCDGSSHYVDSGGAGFGAPDVRGDGLAHHYAIVYDGAHLHAYVDGEITDTPVNATYGSGSPTGDLYLGYCWAGVLSAGIMAARVYAKALSAAEVAQNYGQGPHYALTLADQPAVRVGAGSPEGVVAAAVGTLYLRTDGSTSTTLYVKTSGTGSTGWTAK